ncbi:TadE/TadG family type IV pilus assembly protein [Vibrio harveyi]|nr:TadE/TadG family type IV pilus assembly protein [Vibrio harveyi]
MRGTVMVVRKIRQIGTALIEFTIVAFFYMIIFFTIVDFGVFGYVKLTMQHAVREGARYAITGRTDLDPNNSSDRSAAVIAKIDNASDGLLSRVTNTSNIRVEDIDGNSVAGFGQPRQLISIHLDCEWPSFSPFIRPFVQNGHYKFTVSSAMKNEAF